MSSNEDPKSITPISRSHDFNEYKDKTYEELSQEFQEVYPAAARAFELVPLMYNRLTLVDGLTHKEAVAKIHNDHRHVDGFTERNIRRYLPADNPNLPRRVRTSRPKNSSSPNKYHVIDFEFHLDWDYLYNYLDELRNLGSTLEVWFNGELDGRTGKLIAAHTGRIAERH
jgi:hypothetical protein